MRAGDLIRVDFGVPIGSEPGFVRPAVVVSADAFLVHRPRTIHVVPVTSNVSRSLLSEVALTSPNLELASVAQCHLCAVIGVERLVGEEYGNVGAAELAQIRSVLGDLLDIG